MTSRVMLAAMMLALTQVSSSDIVRAQGAAPGTGSAGLNSEQHQGWLLTLQYCALCHTRTNLHSTTTIGPILSQESGGGRDDVLRQVIADGTPNMPGFKHQFEPREIDAIVAYLKTVPPQAAQPKKH
jgi:mono/diheme cytochrome c family protein